MELKFSKEYSLCFKGETYVFKNVVFKLDEILLKRFPLFETILLNCEGGTIQHLCFGEHDCENGIVFKSSIVNSDLIYEIICFVVLGLNINADIYISILVKACKYLGLSASDIDAIILSKSKPMSPEVLLDYYIYCNESEAKFNENCLPTYCNDFCDFWCDQLGTIVYEDRIRILQNLYPNEFITVRVNPDMDRVSNIGGEVLDFVDFPNNCVIAGGAMVYACVTNSYTYEGMDVDIFTFGFNASSSALQIVEMLKSHEYIAGFMSKSVAVCIKDGHQIQVICTDSNSPEDIINNFDLDYVKVYYSFACQRSRASISAVKCWSTMTIGHEIVNTVINPARLIKAYLKGFDIRSFGQNEYMEFIPNECKCDTNPYLHSVLNCCVDTLAHDARTCELKWKTILRTYGLPVDYIKMLMSRVLGCKDIEVHHMVPFVLSLFGPSYGKSLHNLPSTAQLSPYLKFITTFQAARPIGNIVVQYVSMPFSIQTPYLLIISANNDSHPMRMLLEIDVKMLNFSRQILCIRNYLHINVDGKRQNCIKVNANVDTVFVNRYGDKYIDALKLCRGARIKCELVIGWTYDNISTFPHKRNMTFIAKKIIQI